MFGGGFLAHLKVMKLAKEVKVIRAPVFGVAIGMVDLQLDGRGSTPDMFLYKTDKTIFTITVGDEVVC